MKELKFTPESLERHIRAFDIIPSVCRTIYTTCDEIKSEYYHVVTVDGVGHFILINTYEYPPNARWLLVSNMWKYEGFRSPEEFSRELDKLYPLPRTLHVHQYVEVFLDEE